MDVYLTASYLLTLYQFVANLSTIIRIILNVSFIVATVYKRVNSNRIYFAIGFLKRFFSVPCFLNI